MSNRKYHLNPLTLDKNPLTPASIWIVPSVGKGHTVIICSYFAPFLQHALKLRLINSFLSIRHCSFRVDFEREIAGKDIKKTPMLCWQQLSTEHVQLWKNCLIQNVKTFLLYVR